MAAPSFLETRMLRRQKVGPPDVYPQNPKQREDELTVSNLNKGFKHGISNIPSSEEFSTAHLYTFDSNRINQSFNAVLVQKVVINTFNDPTRKRPQLTKDNFSLVPVINSSKIRHYNAWFKDLASHKGLTQLCKNKVPVFNKKEDIFQALTDFDVPLSRATWFIKMTAAYHLTLTDTKMKKRATNDPNSDWTQAIWKFMREQLFKLNEGSQRGNNELPTLINTTVGSIGLGVIYHMGSTATTISRDDMEKQLKYISNLAHHLYMEGLLDRQEFLTCFVEEFESIPLFNEISLSYFMPFVLQYVEEVAMNHLLARRLCFSAARHLNWILPGNTAPSPSPQQDGETMSTQVNADAASPQSQCSPRLFPIAHTLSCIIQTTVMSCPGALVWYPSDAKSCGSPLDLLPCPPSALPLPELPKDDVEGRKEDIRARNFLQEKEKEIAARSQATEIRWSSNSCQESVTGYTINKVLSSLETLDKQNFDKSASLDTLYHRIFDQNHSKVADAQMPASSEGAVVALLCEWAITTKRLGEHRAAVVAKLLDKRQAYYEQGNNSEQQSSQSETTPESTQHPNDHPMMSCQPPHFQNLLFAFLDTQAPELKNPDDLEELQAFKNLVLLFSELIEHDVFSHDLYVNMLISRGDISPGQLSSLPVYSVATPMTNASAIHNPDLSLSSAMDSQVMKTDEHDADHSFNNPSESVFSPGSRHDRHFLDAVRSIEQSKPQFSAHPSQSGTGVWGYGQNRHVQYIMHFPISFQDDCINYEWNQRLMALYGAGRHKALVKRAVRKVSRHLIKLIQNKRKIEEKSDILQVSAWEASVRGSKPSKTSLDDLLTRYRRLSYFDRHMVTANGAKALLLLINDIAAGGSSDPPQLQAVRVLFDLLGEAMNINDLVRTAVSICSNLAQLSLSLSNVSSDPPSIGGAGQRKGNLWYTAELSLTTVAILRHHQSYLLLNPDLTLETFDGLLSYALQSSLSNPAKCSSPERSVLVLLNDLYVAAPYVRAKHAEFANYVGVVRQALSSTKKPATSNCRYDPTFLKQFIENADAESCLSVAERYSERLHDMSYRYSFVCTAIITLCSGPKNLEKVNALAALCAEMSARCSELSAEWLGVLKALCCSSITSNFNDVLMVVEGLGSNIVDFAIKLTTSGMGKVQLTSHMLLFDPRDVAPQLFAGDPEIRDPLALFTAVLIARSCLSLEDVVKHVAIPSLLPSFSHLGPNEAGPRLTCHLLLQLFKAPVPPNSTGSKHTFHLPSPSDRHLLAAAHRSTADGAVLAVLKAVLKLGDASPPGGRGLFGHDGDVSVTSFLAPIPDFGGYDSNLPDSSASQHLNKEEEETWMEKASLQDFAKHAVRVICSQQWVQDRCLKCPNMDLIMDQVLTKEQRKYLIQLICYADGDFKRLSLLGADPQRYVANMLGKMTRWTLRQCLLELQVMLHESPQEKILPDYIAGATIEVFRQQQQNLESTPDKKQGGNIDLDQCSVWLIAPLISKLSSQVKAQVLQRASNILNKSPAWPSTPTRGGSGGKSDRQERDSGSSLLNYQPFLTLIITCLKGQDSERRSLVESLHTQLVMMQTQWQIARTQKDAGKETVVSSSANNGRNEALQLRLSLVGGMFDIIQVSSQWTSDLVIVLTRLIHCGMVDVQMNRELFHTVYDMIAVLLHNVLGGDMPSRAEGSKRDYLNIVKKIKKEIGEQQSKSITRLRQLLPIQRPEYYVVSCEPAGPLMDVKGSKFPAVADGNSGLQAASKQKLNPWEIIEGLKYPAPLCLVWFGARKTERKMLHYEEERLHLMEHSHGNKRYLDEFLKPPQLPPEEDEAPPQPTKAPERKEKKSIAGAVSPMGGGESKRNQPKAIRNKRLSKAEQKKRQQVPDANPTFRAMPSHPMVNTNILGNVGMPGQGNNFAPPHNPPAYQAYSSINKTVGPGYGPTGGYPSGPIMNKNRPTKQALEMMLRNRRNAQVRANNAGLPYGSSQQIRQKLGGMIKPAVHIGGAHDMYMKQPMRTHMSQQSHVINQSGNPNYMSYNVVPKQTMMHGYNTSGGNTGMYRDTGGGNQVAYHQGGVVQSGQSFVANQQAMRGSSYGTPMQQGQGSYQQHGPVVNMQNQGQQQSQYTINQHSGARSVQMGRLGSQQMGGGMHAMNTGQMQQSSMINQRQIMEQHPQIINQTQQQFGQSMQQPSGAPMMDMGRSMMNQQQY